MKPKLAQIWDREEHEHYVEPEWCSRRLFDIEKFDGEIWDPACGFGRIPQAAAAAGYKARGTDIVNRGYPAPDAYAADFFKTDSYGGNIVSNPPFDIFQAFAARALKLADRKVALIWLVPRLNAARWLAETPLARVWLLTPRPSMPPGHTITAGQKPGGGTQDFCWLVWEQGYRRKPELGWLRRDAAPDFAKRELEPGELVTTQQEKFA